MLFWRIKGLLKNPYGLNIQNMIIRQENGPIRIYESQKYPQQTSIELEIRDFNLLESLIFHGQLKIFIVLPWCWWIFSSYYTLFT